ncbi:MAG: SRPBCC family protein [Deltaproteobacteria bacterium]|nr:SRPBCC family protein [Deltaproteobacteria bacterium]
MTRRFSLSVTTPSDNEIHMVRSFAASRTLIWDALTRAELVQRWLLGPPGWTMPVCEIDLQVGGRWRYVWRGEDGTEFSMYGSYRELAPPDRIVHTETFSGDPTQGEAVVTTVLTEEAGVTTLTQTMRVASQEVRDIILATGMADGVEAGYDRLDALLAT